VLLVRPRGLFPGRGLMIDTAQYTSKPTRGLGHDAGRRGGAGDLALAFARLCRARGLIQDLFFILTMLALAQFWNLLAGYGGLVSVGQQAFVGIGAYAMFAGGDPGGLEPGAGDPAGGAGRRGAGVPTAFFAFRLQGAYFAIGTWVDRRGVPPVRRAVEGAGRRHGHIAAVAMWRGRSPESTGWRTCSTCAPARRATSCLLDGAGAGGRRHRRHLLFLRTRNGLALAAIRDNAEAAESVGVDATRAKFAVYPDRGRGTGVAGGLIFFQSASITPSGVLGDRLDGLRASSSW
jgi:branched-chain amino acid transport system permease protein